MYNLGVYTIKLLFSLLVFLLVSCNDGSLSNPNVNNGNKPPKSPSTPDSINPPTLSPAGNYRGNVKGKIIVDGIPNSTEIKSVLFSIGNDNSLECTEIFDDVVDGKLVRKTSDNSYSAKYNNAGTEYDIKFTVLNKNSISIDITATVSTGAGHSGVHHYTGTLTKS